MIIHKQNHKDKVEHYMGFGRYEMIPTTMCRGAKGYYSSTYKPKGGCAYYWKDVTCKKCLAKRSKAVTKIKK